MRILRLMSALTLAAAALLGSSSAASAAEPVNYVALGDSYSSGVGAPGGSGTCVRSPQGYPTLWRTSHTVASFRDATCAGAVTGDVLSGQVDQLSADTTFVTITIGGNDVNFASTVLTCTTSSSTTCRNTVTRNLTQANLASKLDQTYAAIRSNAPNAEVVVLGYPHLYETSLRCSDIFAPSRANRQILHDGADQLTAIISGRAQAAGFTFSDVRDEFNGHNVCSSSPWVNGSIFSGGSGAYHPNATGYRSGYLAALNTVTG